MLIPSIDLQNGHVVQLVQGERLAIEAPDPEPWIARFASFPRVQLIDLDAARGRGDNRALVQAICGRLPCRVGGGIRSVHDFNQTLPRASYGVAWNGFSSWLHRPLVTTEIPGLYAAGPFSPAGPSPSHVVLSAALAAYACDDYRRITA